MELKDLRSGNLIYTRNIDYSEKAKKGWDLSEIIQINIYGGGYFNLGKDIGKRYNDIDEHCYFSDKCDLKPVELTEELLLKCGFENVGIDGEWSIFGLDSVNICKTVAIGFIFNFDNGSDYVKIKYLHQLQNIYFALTQTELQITL